MSACGGHGRAQSGIRRNWELLLRERTRRELGRTGRGKTDMDGAGLQLRDVHN